MKGIMTLAMGLMLLSGCSLAPEYHPPPINVPQAYKEAGQWVRAHPAQAELDRGPWWRIYNDPELNALEIQIDIGNQNLKAALARYDQARAAVQIARADLYPDVVGGFNPGAIQTSENTANPLPNRRYSDISIGANAIYEIDVWGRVRNAVAAAGDLACASAADLAAINLSLHAQLAIDYFSLRGDDAAQRVLDAAVRNYQKALNLVRHRYQGGAASIGDVDEAKTQLETAITAAADMRLNRSQLEHAIAVLIGKPPAEFTLPVAMPKAKIMTIDPNLPSVLLERRPDIAEAEQLVQAANANIGVARAAFFPSFNLSMGVGLESQTVSNLFRAASLIWAIGPPATATIVNSGSTPLVTQTLFDGGRISGLTDEAWGRYFETVANYRQTVLTAYREVEDNLIAIRQLDLERHSQHLASYSADLALAQAMYRYQGGLTTYLDVFVIVNIALQSKLADVNVNTRRQIASVQLIKALGGSPWR